MKPRKILTKLLDKKGDISYVMTSVCVIAALFVFTGILELIRVNIITAAIRDKYEDAIIYASTIQYADMYQDVRESDAAAYKNTNGRDWLKCNGANRDQILNYLNSAMARGEIAQFTIVSVDFTVTSAGLAPNDYNTAEKFAVEGEITVEIPHDFAWANLPPTTVTLKVKSRWRARF